MGTSIDLGLAALTVVMAGLLALGAELSARRAGIEARAARRLGAFVSAGLCVWLASSTVLSLLGVLSVWGPLPPRFALLPLTSLVAMIVVSGTPTMKRLLAGAPRHWPIAAQTFRVGVELALLGLYLDHRAPVQVTFEGRNLDILAGLTAPVVAWLVARGRLAPPLVVVWNLLGVALLANIVRTAVTSAPGPLYAGWPGQPFTALASWPVVWIPAFLAPVALFLHVVSLRQTLAALRAASPAPKPAP